jgi:hypothetical protein
MAIRTWDPDAEDRNNLEDVKIDGEWNWRKFEAYANYLNELLQQIKKSEKQACPASLPRVLALFFQPIGSNSLFSLSVRLMQQKPNSQPPQLCRQAPNTERTG